MFVEESVWIGRALAELELSPGSRALDVGSSTAEYRLARQPHIEANVHAPLRERGVKVAALDLREGPEIDYSADITAADFDLDAVAGRRFDLVLFNNVMLHLSDRVRGARSACELVAPGGYLLVSSPGAYRRVNDPLDNGFRASPVELVEALALGGSAADLEMLKAESVRIDQRRYYRRSPIHPSWFRLGRGWVPLPGVVEQLRYLYRPLRWRVSCVLMQRPGKRSMSR